MHHRRAQTFNILHKPNPANPRARVAGIGLAIIIVVNAICVAVESMPNLPATWRAPLAQFEAVSTLIFALEYGLRLWACVEQAHLARPIIGRLRYMAQPLPLLDLVVICTYFLPIDLRFIRILRLLGLHQLSLALHQIGHALRHRAQLLIAAVVLMGVAIYFSAALVFQIEHAAQPDKFTSIPATLWWAVVSLTTVGYGDLTPITPLGKLCASAMMIFGIGIFALPTAIFTAAIIAASGESLAQQPHPEEKNQQRGHPAPP
jgi:voltage-gated potassium channel